MNITTYGNPNEIDKICEWTGKKFVVDWKHRNQRFIDKLAMYEWRKSRNRELVKCLTCGNLFERYKIARHWRTGEQPSYCSINCNIKSEKRINGTKKWLLKNQPMNNIQSIKKIASTKFERYGDEKYNNMEKNKKTMITKYGVPYAVYLPQCMSNGKRISKFQRRIYMDILMNYPDAKLEVYLSDVKKAVDIYIPSTNKVIECHGDYWHCNPSKCLETYYNRAVNMTAKEIWERDKQKKILLNNAGYDVEIVWENTNKEFKH